MNDLAGLEPWGFLLVILAAFRVTRFFVFDSLIGANEESESKFSVWLNDWAWYPKNHPKADEDRSWIRGKVGGLLTCPYCFGFWASLGTGAWWVWWVEARWVVVVWAIAGAQALLSTLDRR